MAVGVCAAGSLTTTTLLSIPQWVTSNDRIPRTTYVNIRLTIVVSTNIWRSNSYIESFLQGQLKFTESAGLSIDYLDYVPVRTYYLDYVWVRSLDNLWFIKCTSSIMSRYVCVVHSHNYVMETPSTYASLMVRPLFVLYE